MMHNTDLSLVVKQMELGSMNNFVYIVGDKRTQDCLVIDPSWDVPKIINQIKELNLNLKAVFITHDHPDHTNGLEELLEAYDVPVYISKYEMQLFFPNTANIRRTEDDQIVRVGMMGIRCVHTPGHSPGSQCYLIENNLFSGDTLFIDACGRCDLPGSNPEDMYDSIQKIKKLPDNTIIYPGHNYAPQKSDTLANQKLTNIYLKVINQTEFMKNRMGF